MPHSCGTRDGLQVFENDRGETDGFCFSCNTYVKHPLGVGAVAGDIPTEKRVGKSREETEQTLREIPDYPITDLPNRKLRSSALEHFDIRVGVSQEDGKTPTIAYFPYTLNGEIIGYKVRLLEEKKMCL